MNIPLPFSLLAANSALSSSLSTMLVGLAFVRQPFIAIVKPLFGIFLTALLSACIGGTADDESSSSLSSEQASSAAALSSSNASESSLATSSSPSISSQAMSSQSVSSQAESSEAVSSVTVSSSSLSVSSSSVLAIPSSAASSSSVATSSSAISSVSSMATSSSQQSSDGVDPATIPSLLSDGTFSDGLQNFRVNFLGDAKGSSTARGQLRISIDQIGDNDWNVQLLHDVNLKADQQYTFCYDAWSPDGITEVVSRFDADRDGLPNDTSARYRTLSRDPETGKTTKLTFALPSSRAQAKHTFFTTDGDATARMNFALGLEAGEIRFDNIGLYEGDQCGNPGTFIPPQTGGGVGSTLQAEALNPDVSQFFKLESAGEGKAVGFFGAGSVICYDDVDLTGVNSIDVFYARNDSQLPTDGRFAILAGGPDPASDEVINLGEKFTTSTGSWTQFEPLSVGLEPHNIGLTQLCIYGVEAGGVGNFDKFTLKAESASNDGVTDFALATPPMPSQGVLPVTVDLVDVRVGGQNTKQRRVLFGGQQMSLAGMSFFWSAPNSGTDAFYNKDTVDFLVDEWDVKLVRAAMAVDDDKPNGASIEELGGYLTRPFPNQHALEEVVHAAIANDIYVIIDWHAHKAEQNTAAAVEFFKEMATKYGTFNNVIYEIYNEPVDTSWRDIKSYAEEVITAIREIDPDNLIIVGTGFYSQNVDEAAEDPITDFDNIAYTLHFYARSHKQSLRNKAIKALEGEASNNYRNAIALFVTEWGLTAASGDGSLASNSDINAWLDFMEANKISHANWAISSHPQSSAAVKKGRSTRGGWDDDDLTEGGIKVREIIRNQNAGIDITD